MFKSSINEIIGVFPVDNTPELCLLEKKKGRWFKGVIPVNTSAGNFNERFRNALRGIKPSRRRSISIGLPREMIFMREVSFPNLTEEQALNSARLSISLYCHLNPEDVYHDEWVFSRGDIATVIISYVPRKIVDSLLEIVEESGHGRSHVYVSPVTVGLDILIRKFASNMTPCIAQGFQEDRLVISLHGDTAWEGSHFISSKVENALEKNNQDILTILPHIFKQLVNKPTVNVMDGTPSTEEQLENIQLTELVATSGDKESTAISWGLCAAATALESYPPILFQDGERKRPFKLNITTFQIVSAVSLLLCLYLTADIFYKVNNKMDELEEVRKQEKNIEKILAPMKSSLGEMEKLKERVEKFKHFETEYAPPLQILKVLAETTPKSTWIKNFNYRKGSLRLSSEGGSAIETMQAWRENPLLSRVKLTSPVTKNREQEDRFTVNINIPGGKE